MVDVPTRDEFKRLERKIELLTNSVRLLEINQKHHRKWLYELIDRAGITPEERRDMISV